MPDHQDARVILERALQGAPIDSEGFIDGLLKQFPTGAAALGQLDAREVLELIHSIQVAKEIIDPCFVATIPRGAVPRRVRATRPVVREMIMRCRRSLLLLGFDITPDSGVLEFLQQAAVNVDPSNFWIITERTREASRTLLQEWPSSLPKPRLFVNDGQTDLRSLMHCKVLCVDAQDLLVTSANFTAGGMERNIEYGVQLKGQTAGEAAWAFARHLRQSRALSEVGTRAQAGPEGHSLMD